jgi:ABC-type transport system involved in cytochrome bd biosynthesis fused ATPase/permease subunit
MEQNKNSLTPEQIHQRQSWLQIWLPLIVILFVASGLLTLLLVASGNGQGSLNQWSAISIILMIFPALLLLLPFVILQFFFIKWISQGNLALPKLGGMARQKVTAGSQKIQNGANQFVDFFLKIASFRDTVKSLFSRKAE